VASNYWPLGRRNESFRIEIVQVPVFGPAEGIPFLRFGRELPPGQDRCAFVMEIEEAARQIAGNMSDKEYRVPCPEECH
jgi:hypothetical protein